MAGSLGAPESPVNIRDRLLTRAGITEPEQVAAIKEAWDTKKALLKATQTKFFSHEGTVTDHRDVGDNRIQLDAAEAIDRFLGVVAPRADQKVEVVHRLELPSWALPDNAPATAHIIEVQAVDVTPGPATIVAPEAT